MKRKNPETTSEEKKEESKEDESKMDVDKKEDAKKAGGLFGFFSKGDKSDEKEEKKNDEKKEDEAKKGDEKKEEKSEEKKAEEKKESEKKADEKKSEDDDIVEIKKTEEKPVEVEEIDLIPSQEKLVTFLKWDHTDAPYYLKEVRSHQIMSQEALFMAMSSPHFKSILYPMQDVQRKEVNGMQPKTFRKILDYLFRGRVPLSSIEDAWKIKVAGKTFQLKELEELCTKFLQYRIDSRNLIHFLKNTTKYNTTDLRDVVITRFLKNADKGFEDEQMLDLTEGEMFDIMSRRPEVQARKIIEVLIKWAKKRHADKKAELEKARKLEE